MDFAMGDPSQQLFGELRRPMSYRTMNQDIKRNFVSQFENIFNGECLFVFLLTPVQKRIGAVRSTAVIKSTNNLHEKMTHFCSLGIQKREKKLLSDLVIVLKKKDVKVGKILSTIDVGNRSLPLHVTLVYFALEKEITGNSFQRNEILIFGIIVIMSSTLKLKKNKVIVVCPEVYEIVIEEDLTILDTHGLGYPKYMYTIYTEDFRDDLYPKMWDYIYLNKGKLLSDMVIVLKRKDREVDNFSLRIDFWNQSFPQHMPSWVGLDKAFIGNDILILDAIDRRCLSFIMKMNESGVIVVLPDLQKIVFPGHVY